jgi:hypothetical protein
MASAGRFTPAAADEVVEALMARRRFDMGWSGGGPEIRLLLVDTYNLCQLSSLQWMADSNSPM